MSDTRLDAETLRWVADMMTMPRTEPQDEQERGADRAMSILAAGLYERAAEAASRPPTLSDWVRACEVSKLGRPEWHGREWSDTGWLVATWPRRWQKVLIYADGEPLADHVTLTTSPRDPARDPDCAEVYTPAELTAALDRLAEDSGDLHADCDDCERRIREAAESLGGGR